MWYLQMYETEEGSLVSYGYLKTLFDGKFVIFTGSSHMYLCCTHGIDHHLCQAYCFHT